MTAPDLRAIGISYKCEDGWHVFMVTSEPGFYVASKDYRKACADVLPSLKKLHELDAPSAPIEVLVPRPEPSMSMFANKQDYETARSGAGVQPPAGDDRACSTHPLAPHGFDRNASHSLGRYVCECEDWEPDEKEGLQEPAIEDRARLLDLILQMPQLSTRFDLDDPAAQWIDRVELLKAIEETGVEPDAAIREQT